MGLVFLRHCSHSGFLFLCVQQWVVQLVQQQVPPPELQQEALLVTLATSTGRRSLTVPEVCLAKPGLARTRSLPRQWTLCRTQSGFLLVALVALLSEPSSTSLVHVFPAFVHALPLGDVTTF